MLEPCKRCFYTITANYQGSLEAVDCHFHSVRYDMIANRVTFGVSDWASSGHLRRCSDADTPNQCLSRVKDASILSRLTIMEDISASQITSSGHLRRCSDADTPNQCLSRREIQFGARVALQPSQIGPHQVTYDVVATPIRPTNA
eukprot:scaffold5387_cov75-Skeletonema_dohrnii-CCMP3373.AAC.1